MEKIKDKSREKISAAEIKIIRENVGDDIGKFRRAVQRRLFGEPFAYIFNKTEFLGVPLYIDRRVYVPNPETEEMVKTFLTEAKDGSTVVDVGCGSGAITVAIKLNMKNTNVYGADIDPAALEVARINAKKNRVNVDFYESSYVDDIHISSPDYVISDLPYGNENYTLSSIDIREFSHMPPISLFHPAGILGAYQELIESILKKKWKTVLFFESGRVEKSEVAKIVPKNLKWEYVKKENYSFTKVYFD